MSSNTVELNGKRYDAATGVLLGNSRRPRPNRVISTPRGHHQGRSIDGFAGKPPTVDAPAPKVTSSLSPKLSNVPAKSHARSMDGFAHNPNNLTPHLPEHSLTLKREAVKAPRFHMKPAMKKLVPAEKHAAVLHPVAPKPSASRINPNRLAHASQVPRSQHVKHFGPNRTQAPQPAPATPRRKPIAPVAPQRIQPTEEDMFESAIAQATSHEQKAPKQRLSWKRKLTNAGAVVLALAVIGIFVAYLNLPTIEVSLASRQAGFNVTMPNYKALGFTFESPVKTTDGTVAMDFASGDSKFTLTQEASNWDNNTLMDSLATQSDSIPKAIQSDGHTIYITNANEATWVDGGVRYDLTGNDNLSNQQITAVADSL